MEDRCSHHPIVSEGNEKKRFGHCSCHNSFAPLCYIILYAGTMYCYKTTVYCTSTTTVPYLTVVTARLQQRACRLLNLRCVRLAAEEVLVERPVPGSSGRLHQYTYAVRRSVVGVSLGGTRWRKMPFAILLLFGSGGTDTGISSSFIFSYV